MGLLEVAGPVMIGPSSSHTLGALKIARFVFKLMGRPDEVTFVLHGSFGFTFRGHGTDRALLAGILGLRPDDPQVRNAIELARAANVKFSFESGDLGDVHPNTVLIRAMRDHVRNEVRGSSIGGGAVRINQINGVDCDLSGEMPTLVLVNKDQPGALKSILECIPYNIANIYLRRINALQGLALTIVELDSNVEPHVFERVIRNRFVAEAYFVNADEGDFR